MWHGISVVFSTEGRAHFSADETGMARNAAWGLLLCNGWSRRSAEPSKVGWEARSQERRLQTDRALVHVTTLDRREAERPRRDTEGVATDMEAKQTETGPEGILVVG